MAKISDFPSISTPISFSSRRGLGVSQVAAEKFLDSEFSAGSGRDSPGLLPPADATGAGLNDVPGGKAVLVTCVSRTSYICARTSFEL